MPLYEYRCGDCGSVAEINHRMSDPSPTDCPECGAAALSKLISAAGFRLKGSGWYETDFKSEGKRNLAGDSGGTDSKSGGGANASGGSAKPDSGSASGKSDSSASSGKSDSKPSASSSASSSPSPAKSD